MHTDQSILDTEYLRYQEVTDAALRNPEIFRRDACRALKAFTQRERTILKNITAVLPAGRFFDEWERTLRGPRNTLRANQQNKSFLNTLQKYLLLEEKNAPHIASSLIATQDQLLVQRFIQTLDIPDTRQGKIAEKTLEKLLQWSDQHLLSLQQHYALTTVYYAVAAAQKVPIYDPYDSSFARMRANKAIRRHRKQLLKQEQKTLRETAKALRSLTKNRLIEQTVGTQIEPVEFFGARTAYEKKLAEFDEKEAAQLTVRAELMMQESRHLKSAYHKLAKDITANTLTMHDASFDELVRTLFTLSTIQKNKFMLDIKKYRELLRQREEILSASAARRAVLLEEA